MDLLTHALRGATHETAATAQAAQAAQAALLPPPRLLLAGAGGALGSALLAECLVPGRARSVAALVQAPLASTLRGLTSLWPAELAAARDLCDLALLVLERERHANGRDEAFFRPDAGHWLPLARALHAAGAKRLVLVVPHRPAQLPEALRHGLASEDEAALAALGFEQLLIVRAARPGEDAARGATQGLAQRLGRLWWQQMRFMVPQREQPLTTPALARCVLRLALRLPHAAAGRTMVLAPDLLWQAWQDANAPGRARGGLRAEAEAAQVAGRFDAWADAFFTGRHPLGSSR
jgi:hypothetical protein